ncbi:MAG: hypothetical protein IT337_12050 [Thermomicrobiales bacterium]|nr:hypothetical protein [Thermomicrobiales bacterium]
MTDSDRREAINSADHVRRFTHTTFADPVNDQYPIDTPDHVREAWQVVHQQGSAAGYTPDEIAFMEVRIAEAAQTFGIQLPA